MIDQWRGLRDYSYSASIYLVHAVIVRSRINRLSNYRPAIAMIFYRHSSAPHVQGIGTHKKSQVKKKQY